MRCVAQVPLFGLLLTIAGLTAAAPGTEVPGVCKIPEDQPPCRANLPAWVYNKTAGYCEKLAHGGCYKTGSFSSEEDCNVKCRDPVLGLCAAPVKRSCGSGSKQYFFDPEMRQCSSYDGCFSTGRVSNGGKTFSSFKDCNDTCERFAQDPCLLSQDSGKDCREEPAASRTKTWFSFNSEKGVCEALNYKGCAGNRNRFRDEKDCWKVCAKHMKTCNLPLSSGYACGHHKGKAVRVYGYNPKSEKCERFMYKGCGGNNNKFRTARDCWNTCARASSNNCAKDPNLNVDGIGIYQRYYYDRGDDKCKFTRFFTKSNDGKNRFYTVTECQKECKAYYKGETNWMED